MQQLGCSVQDPNRHSMGRGWGVGGGIFLGVLGACLNFPFHKSRGCNQDLRLGPSWALVLLNALVIRVEGKQLVLETALHGHDHPEKRLKKRLFFTSKWTTVWHNGVAYTILNTNSQSFHRPIAMEEERPSFETFV